MTNQTAEFIFGSWSAAQVPVAIEYPLEVMDEIRAAATDGLQKLARGGLEIGGVLFGSRRDNGIRIVTWRPISCEHALGPTLHFSERDRADLAGLLASAAGDPELEGLQPVGWFVTHTRTDVSLSPNDLEIFDAHFAEPWQVTLVLHPTQVGPARAGFFAREADGSLKSDASYQEFMLKPLHRTSQLADAPQPVVRERSNARLKPEGNFTAPKALNAEPAPATHVEPPLFRTLERSKAARGWLWMLPLILGLMVAGLFVKERYLAKENQAFFFHVNDAGDTVEIEWDKNAAPIRNSHLGAIDIKDSGGTQRYPLSDEQLHAGKMSYARRGGELEMHMTVYPVGYKPVQEFAHFLDPGAATPAVSATPPPPSEAEQLRKERDELRTEVEQLKDELRKARPLRRRR